MTAASPLLPALALALAFVGGCATDGQARSDPGTDRASVRRIVVEEAMRQGVPVSLALAVAHAESHFNPYAESHKGARGVMQIMPATARLEYGIDPDQLWRPRLNVRLGLHFLSRLLERYRGRVDLALSYYNGGSRVGDLPHARVIPATRPYVARVRELQVRYRQGLLEGRV